ncbi:MAG TPA: tRNA adenosine(34) deaminase TadA [Ilumatobacteraceae bacterium]|nr:tRNA adenosine(34) deaminase TadA [Ilumatobacteraceae bacterium]
MDGAADEVRDTVTDDVAMGRALAEARLALDHGDVPIGAVVLRDGDVIASRHNERELTGDPTAHAEVLALRDAAAVVGHWRLDECTLVVTLEPCVMCAGAVVNARVGRLVYGATDPKAGAAGSLYDVPADTRLNHRPPVTRGVRAGECGDLLRAFFAARRSSSAGRGDNVPPRKDARVDEWDGLESR